MEHKNEYSMIVQHSINGAIHKINNQFVWEMHGEKPSFRSMIRDHILIIDSKFYEQLPQQLRPFPCVNTIVIKDDEHFKTKEPVYVVDSISEAFGYAAQNGQKRFVVGSPSIYMQIKRMHQYEMVEMLIAEIDRYHDSAINVRLPADGWNNKQLYVRQHPDPKVTYSQYSKIA